MIEMIETMLRSISQMAIHTTLAVDGYRPFENCPTIT